MKTEINMEINTENFTEDEFAMLSNGLLALISNAEKAKELLCDVESINAISKYQKELIKLNSKICGLMKSE